MQDSFAWFRTRSRFDAYVPVYGDLALGKLVAPDPANAVRAISLARHELVFETDAVGSPHLIKIAYHPRWQLQSKGQLALAGPGYMLVVPQERAIRLVYGHTLVGKLGIAATALAALYALLALWSRRRQALLVTPQERTLKPWWPALIAWLALLAAVSLGTLAERLAWLGKRCGRIAMSKRRRL
jgi:hypothetical protein